MRHLLITGGTGTLGTALLNQAIKSNKFKYITVFSRDENKQQQMRKHYPDVDFVLGDITGKLHFHGVTDVFHCAALKHVDLGESQPAAFADTNYFGTVNLFRHCLKTAVENFAFFSTDKAVLPINAYGFTKALAEKYLMANRDHGTNVSIYRWGNIVGSRGSVIPSFARKMEVGEVIPVTHMNMSRFWLTIHDAAEFVMDTFEKEHAELPLICPKIKAAKLTEVIDAIGYITGLPYSIEEVGIRPGEKIHECLKSDHDGCIRSDNCEQYTMEELIDLIRPSILAV